MPKDSFRALGLECSFQLATRIASATIVPLKSRTDERKFEMRKLLRDAHHKEILIKWIYHRDG